jgi:hypothetical protein
LNNLDLCPKCQCSFQNKCILGKNVCHRAVQDTGSGRHNGFVLLLLMTSQVVGSIYFTDQRTSLVKLCLRHPLYNNGCNIFKKMSDATSVTYGWSYRIWIQIGRNGCNSNYTIIVKEKNMLWVCFRYLRYNISGINENIPTMSYC